MNIARCLVLAAAIGQITVAAQTPRAPSNLRFGTGGTSRCPAMPSFPDANCTGVIPGTTLTACNGTISASNGVFDKCLFSGGITLTGKNVTINNSRIMGVITGDYTNSGLDMTDVEINGNNSTLDATNGLFGYTCTRCNVHHAAKAFTGNNFTVEDSYVHELYGSGASHNEAVLGSSGNIVIRHSTLVAKFSSSSTGGGMSAAIALYTHTSFWPSLNNVLIENNRISAAGAVYCVYGGNSTDTDGNPSNVRFLNNVFVLNDCGTGGLIVGWLRGNGNVWTNNSYSDGTPIPEPATNDYTRATPTPTLTPTFVTAKNDDTAAHTRGSRVWSQGALTP